MFLKMATFLFDLFPVTSLLVEKALSLSILTRRTTTLFLSERISIIIITNIIIEKSSYKRS
jgi:hypothetical protein